MEKPFWTFSLEFYGLPDVAPACLRCQDEAGADVNLILFVLWRAASGVRVAEAELPPPMAWSSFGVSASSSPCELFAAS